MLRLQYLTLVTAVFAPTFAAAQDLETEWDFYWQINLGIINADNGVNSETSLVDNDNSNSRVGIFFRQNLANGGQFSFNVESGIGLRETSTIDGDDNDVDVNYSRRELRKFEIAYETPSMGTLWFGQGSIATDGSGDADFSGTGVAAYAGITDLAANQSLGLNGGTVSSTKIGNAFSTFDGGRRFRVRYDTPTYNGFGFAVSAGKEVLAEGNDDEYYDVGVTYDKDYGAYKVAARLGHSIRDSDEAFTVGSTAILHQPTGLSFALAAGQARDADTDYVYAKAGFQRDWSALGRTYLSADYYTGSDFAFSGSDSDSIGLAVVQSIDAYNVELYATYRTYDVDGGRSNFDDLDVTLIGARWKF